MCSDVGQTMRRKRRHDSTQALESTKGTAAAGHRSQRGKFTIMSLILGVKGTSLKTTTLFRFPQLSEAYFQLVFYFIDRVK